MTVRSESTKRASARGERSDETRARRRTLHYVESRRASTTRGGGRLPVTAELFRDSPGWTQLVHFF